MTSLHGAAPMQIYDKVNCHENKMHAYLRCAAGIATRYGMESPGTEFRWWRDFLHPSTPALGPTQPPMQWAPDHSRGKVVGAWLWPPTPSIADVKV